MEEANDLGIKSVQLSGGEPFLYTNLNEVLKSTKGKNFTVTISTNGTLIDDRSAELLAEINARVVTSIDGPEIYHDIFRGRRGSFAKAENGIARLVDLGIPIKIVTTVCNDNLKYIDWCANWAYKIKAGAIQFQPLERIGRGKGIENNRLQEEKLHDLFIKLNDLVAFYTDKDFKVTMTYQSREFMTAHPCTAFVCNGKSCHRGVEKELKKIVIREDGSILPELVDIDRKFSIGNLLKDTLKNNLLAYLNEGYPRFDRFCRRVYQDMVLNSSSPLISWNEILTERSRTF
jgi:MoaA/NifB/PqqE/SkfB family radical SAM enzyme